MKELTEKRRNQLASDIYNISRRVRQLANGLEDCPAKEKMETYIKQLNDIGTEIDGGGKVMISKILR